MTLRLGRLGAPAAALMLSGCVGALLGGKPDQLYRFGTPGAAVSDDAAGRVPSRTLVIAPVTFPAEASADRLLTSQGRALSYVKDTRWVTAAPTLYQNAVEAAMRSSAGVAAVDRSKLRSANGELRIVIDRFEAAYGTGPNAPPVIQIEGRASLLIAGASMPILHRIHWEQPAAQDRAGALAAAFDGAVSQSTIDLASWVAASLPPEPATEVPARPLNLKDGRMDR